MAVISALAASLTLESAAFIRDLGRATQVVNNAAAQMNQQASAMTKGFAGVNAAVSTLKSTLAGFGIGIGVSGMVQITAAIGAGVQQLYDGCTPVLPVELLQPYRCWPV